jgi:aromatic ring-opening dioxygenase catalytic subunit (LigB family)
LVPDAEACVVIICVDRADQNNKDCNQGELLLELRGETGVIIAGALFAISFTVKNQSHVCLESLSKKFKKDITDERGYHGNFKIGSGKNISDCPS